MIDDCEKDDIFALDVVVLFDLLQQHFEDNPQVSAFMPLGEA